MINRLNQASTTKWLIMGSLSLLLLFLSNWIKGVYQEEKEGLEKEIAYLVKDAVHEVEDSLLHDLLITKIKIPKGGAERGFGIMHQRDFLEKDSLRMVYSQGYPGADSSQKDTTLSVVIRTFSDTSDEPDRNALLPMLMNLQRDSLKVMVDAEEDSLGLLTAIQSRFDQLIQDSPLPKAYQITRVNELSNTDALSLDFYNDPMQQKSYVAVFSNYRGYLLNRIKNQLIFAFLLFAAIGSSFYLIYKNWRKQKELIDLKNDFISNVTHELKTPISTVSVALEALSNFDVLKNKAMTKEYLEISRKELNRLKILVDKVLKMSIFEKGASKLQIEKLRMDTLLEEVLASMKIQFEKEKAAVQKEIVGQDFSVQADKIHLTNVLYNLLDNAIKYCREHPIISIRLEEAEDAIHLYIKDNGIGIDKEDQGKVFKRFFRVPSGDTHDVKGHGLGLSYVASVIDKHKGNIHLTSRLNQGSTFHIRLNKSLDEN